MKNYGNFQPRKFQPITILKRYTLNMIRVQSDSNDATGVTVNSTLLFIAFNGPF